MSVSAKILPILFLSLVTLNAVSCHRGRDPSKPPVILALVNGVPILEEDFRFRVALEMEKYGDFDTANEGDFRALKKEVLYRMIENRIIIDWGSKKGVALFDKDVAEGLAGLKRGYTDKEFEMMLEEKKNGLSYLRSNTLASSESTTGGI